jgi:hypothetical protein
MPVGLADTSGLRLSALSAAISDCRETGSFAADVAAQELSGTSPSAASSDLIDGNTTSPTCWSKASWLQPVRGHSNVQGNRTCGIDHRPGAMFLDRLHEVCGITPPREHGMDTVATIEAMRAGQVTVFVCASPRPVITDGS